MDVYVLIAILYKRESYEREGDVKKRGETHT
jgi:hypothetical protein